MKAAVLYGKEDVRVQTVDIPPVREGEVRVQIEAALTCGTDLKVFKRGYHAKMIVPPAVFGHELAGRISEIGAGVTGWQLNDPVVVANSAPCGHCFYCHNDQENLCDNLLFLNGAYAESIVVPARLVQKNMLKLQPGTKFKDAALTEPLACVVQGLAETAPKAGQRLLVIGSGPIGLMFVALAKEAKCLVTVAGRGKERLEMARKLGAETVIDVAGKNDLVEALRAAAPDPFDIVIEAVGKPETWEASTKLIRKGGKVNFFGGCPTGTTVTLDTALLHYSNITLLATFHHSPKSIRKALGYIESGLIHSGDFVSGESSLSGLPDLLKSMAAGNKAVKTLIRVKE